MKAGPGVVSIGLFGASKQASKQVAAAGRGG